MTNWFGLLLAVTALCNFAAFAWAVHGHFDSARTPLGMKVVSVLFVIGFLGCLGAVGNAPVPGWRIAIAVGLQALAGGLFVWACAATRRIRPEMAFSPSKPTVLFRTGPYRYVRHPFYSSYIIFWLSCTIATNSITVTVVTILLIIIYTAAALQEQSVFLNSAFRLEYEAYRRTAGLFWPRPRSIMRKD